MAKRLFHRPVSRIIVSLINIFSLLFYKMAKFTNILVTGLRKVFRITVFRGPLPIFLVYQPKAFEDERTVCYNHN